MNDMLRLRAGAVEWRELDGELVALEHERSLYLTANPAGTLLWRELVTGATRSDLVGALLSTYAVASDVAEEDVDAFVATARAHGLLE
jgi:hypothetical protein